MHTKIKLLTSQSSGLLPHPLIFSLGRKKQKMKGKKMKHLILGIIGLVWGSAVLINGISKIAKTDANTAYCVGSYIGLAFGLALAIAGVFSIIKWKNSKAQKS
jgi:hypothetical protein